MLAAVRGVGLSPRVRGSPDFFDRHSPSIATGLSPRVRGSRAICFGILPPPIRVYPRVCGGAVLGPNDAGWALRAWVYPRVCGGAPRSCSRSESCRLEGLSPRVRGSPLTRWMRKGIPACAGEPARLRQRGSIPACAGEPAWRWHPARGYGRVYPRVCGGAGHQALSDEAFPHEGLSPRVRGSLSCQPFAIP